MMAILMLLGNFLFQNSGVYTQYTLKAQPGIRSQIDLSLNPGSTQCQLSDQDIKLLCMLDTHLHNVDTNRCCTVCCKNFKKKVIQGKEHDKKLTDEGWERMRRNCW